MEGPRGVMVKSMDCGIVVSEFVLQSRYYVHFRANTLGKGMNPLISLQLCSSPQAGLLDNILYPHIVAECIVNEKRSTRLIKCSI